MEVEKQKAALRAAAKVGRVSRDPRLCDTFWRFALENIEFEPGDVVAGVWPLPGELDLRPLLHALHERGCTVVLPETTPRGQALMFRRWHPDAVMIAERFGTFRPDGPVLAPSLILVPLLAFDRRGYRLGYGGGYYDRTLAALPGARAIGFGFAAQEVVEVPVEAHDRRLDRIVTEREMISTAANTPLRT